MHYKVYSLQNNFLLALAQQTVFQLRVSSVTLIIFLNLKDLGQHYHMFMELPYAGCQMMIQSTWPEHQDKIAQLDMTGRFRYEKLSNQQKKSTGHIGILTQRRCKFQCTK